MAEIGGQGSLNTGAITHMPASNNGAGALLRRLREHRGLAQDSLVGPDGVLVLNQANYSRVERGLATPTRDKLDAILNLFQASYNERQEILTAFGYPPPKPLPTQAEMDAVRERCQPTLDALPVPAFISDIITRLAATNCLFEQLIGEGDLLRRLQGQPLFKAQFEGMLRLPSFTESMESYLLETARMIRYRLAPYQSEAWYADFVEELCTEEPAFRHYWDASEGLEPPEPPLFDFANRIFHPVSYAMPGSDGVRLQFYSNPEELKDDNRFWLICLVPSDSFSLRQIERWRMG